MDDTIGEAIKGGTLDANNISYRQIRQIAGRQCGCHQALGYGRAILSSVEHLDQYLLSYGPMTEGQWSKLLNDITIPSHKPIHIVDYGCGQGLGTALVLDHFDARLRNAASDIVLIEPSQVALARAHKIIALYCPHSKVHDVNVKLDDVEARDLRLSSDHTNVHIFSNVLDIQTFDHGGLFTKILSVAGEHIVLAASHNRDFDGGAQRLRSLEGAVKDEKHRHWLHVQRSNIDEFVCPNGMPAISWHLCLEVSK